MKAGKSMTDASGRLDLAAQLRKAAERLEFDRAVLLDTAKVLESDAARITPPPVWPVSSAWKTACG